MEPIHIDRALCFMRICWVEASAEVLSMVFFLGLRWPQGFPLYPAVSLVIGLLRWGMVANFIRLASRTRNEVQGFDGHSARFGLANSCASQFWHLATVVQCMWHLVTVCDPSNNDEWSPLVVVVLVALNAVVNVASICLLYTPPEDDELAPSGVKTFTHRSRKGRGPPLQFGASCSICFADVAEGQKVGQLPCGHAFHATCIRQWLALKDSCPMRCSGPRAATIGAVGGAAAATVEASLGAALAAAAGEGAAPAAAATVAAGLALGHGGGARPAEELELEVANV